MTEDHLTQPFDERIKKLTSSTPPGMAHWSGTGPDGTTCKSCVHARFHGYVSTAANNGMLKPIHCNKFKQMMSVKSPAKFSADKASCRFYAKGDGPPTK